MEVNRRVNRYKYVRGDRIGDRGQGRKSKSNWVVIVYCSKLEDRSIGVCRCVGVSIELKWILIYQFKSQVGINDDNWLTLKNNVDNDDRTTDIRYKLAIGVGTWRYTRVETGIFPFGSSALWLDYDLWSGLVMRNVRKRISEVSREKDRFCLSVRMCVIVYVCIYVCVFVLVI